MGKKLLFFILALNCLAFAARAAVTVTGFAPTTAPVGGTVVITGTNFNSATVVSFGGVAAASYVVNSNTQITAVVGNGSSGSVLVTSPSGTGSRTGFTITAPTITSFSPTSAAVGATVTITGTNLTGASAVSFGGTPATSFNVVSSTSITAVVGSGTNGSASVTTPGGTATLAGFTIAAPTISSFSPTSAAVGATVTITGTNLTGATAVTFGGTAATSFNVVSSTSITAVVGNGTSGSIAVTTPGGTATKTGFTMAAPTISSFTPTSAGTGTTVTITGTNFTAASAVSFGGTAATSYTVVSSTSITAVVAAGTSGSVSVTALGGTATLAGFTFVAAPTITSFTPTSSGNGLSVVITGTNLTGATAVSFGGTAATSFVVNSATQITAVVGAGASGSVSVTTAGGTGTKTGFTWVAAPTISSFTPTSAASGTTVTITGTGFTGATAVSFGGTAATSYTVVNSTTITAVVAGGTSGSVSVTTAGGTATKTGFTFIAAPTITSFTPTSAATGATVVITGTNFTGATAVSFGGTAATSYSVLTSTTITAVVAAGTSGNVSVTTPGGTATLAGFTYTAPNAYIYIHQKTLNEQSAVDFAYTMTGSANASFSLNNNPSFIQIGDIGAGHGTTSGGNGDGELWVIGNSASASYNVAAAGLTGGIYRRPSASAQWVATNVTTNILAIDGAYYNQCVYVNSSGNVYFYYNGTSTQIYSGANATDVAAGGGNIAIVEGGVIQVYNKQYVAGASINTTNGAWTTLNGGLNTTTATRLDFNLAGTSILSSYINGTTETIYTTAITVSGGTGSTAGTVNQGSVNTASTFTRSTDAYGNAIGGSANNPDVAYDDKGYIYAMASSQIYNAGDAVYSNTSGSFVYEPQSRAVQRITASSGGQAWAVIADGTANTIWARNTDGTHIWIDDERVRVSGVGYTYKTGGGTGTGNTNSGVGVTNGNVIMIPVPAGTYSISETLPDATWDLGRYTTYVPATSSVTTDVSGRTATVTIAAGDVVHVEFFNEKLSPKAIALTCTASVLEDFGTDATGTNTFGDTVQGTAYHYYPQGNGTPTSSTAPQDGKYYLVKDLTHWFVNNGLQSHSNAGTGYYLLVNASYAQDEFYRKRVTNLVPGLQYTITFYAANVNFTTGTTVIRIPPNVSYGLQDASGNIVASATTGSIDSTGPTQWDLFSFTFTATTSQADFFLRNNNIGGLGNDIALDDISLNPVITPLPNITVSPAIAPNICIGTNYTFSNTQSGGIWTANPTTVATINGKTGKAKGLTAGTAIITYTYTNAIGCVSTNTTGIIVSAAPTLTTSDLLSGTSCKNQADSLYGTPSGGTTPYTYAWVASPAGTDGLSTANIANTAATPTASGTYTYTLTVTDKVGCAASSGVSLTVSNNTAPLVNASSTGPYCTNSSFSLSSSATGGSGSYTYLWSATPTGNGLGTTNTQNTTASPTASGNFVYKVVVNDGFCNVPKFVNVSASTKPTVTVSGPAPGQLCSGGTVNLTSTVTGSSGTLTYAWSGSRVSGLDLTGSPGLQAPTNAASLVAKPTVILATSLVPDIYNYVLTVTDGNSCSASGNTNVSVYLGAGNPPTVSITSPTTATSVCSGNTISLTATAAAGSGTSISSYSWSGPGSYSSAVVSPGNITPTATGSYTLTVTEANGCKASATTPTITFNSSPTATASSFGAGLCNSGKDSVYAAASGGTAPYTTYAWAVSPSSGGIAISAPSNDTSAVTGGSTGQAYLFTVTVTDSKNCTATGSTTITRVNATGPSISVSNVAATYCVGSTINLAATRTGGTSAFTYAWSAAPTTGGGLVSANATSTTAVPTATGSYVYSVKVTDANNCAALASTPTQTVNSALTVTAVSSAPGFCGGTSSATIVAVPSGGSGTYTNYAWSTSVVASPGTTTVNPTSSTTSSSTTASISGATPGTSQFKYTATVTDNNGCTSAAASTVLVVGNTISLNTPVATIPSACVGQTFTLASTSFTGGTTGFNYTWSAPTGVTVNTSSGTIASSPVPSTTALASVAGNYTFGLLVVDALNCTASGSTAIAAVTQVSPSISFSCGNTSGVEWVNLLESNGSTWAWTTTSGGRFYTDATLSPATDGTTSSIQSPYVTYLGTYSVSITDANGCTGSGSYTIVAGSCSVTLAVSGLDFKAQKQGSEALLTWSTTSEINNNRFDVERSSNGTNWQIIGTVKGKGNSNTLTKYSFTDALPLSGINYYRLKQVNDDGGLNYSPVKSLQFSSQWLVKMYPNPAQSFIVLEFNNDREEKAGIVIQNALGSSIYTTTQQLVKGLNRITLNQIQPLAQGTYLITVGTNENIFRSKFVKGGN